MATALIISQKLQNYINLVKLQAAFFGIGGSYKILYIQKIKWIPTPLNNRNNLRISLVASLYTVLCTTEHMKDFGIPISCPLLTRIFLLVLVHKRTQILHTRRSYIKKYYHNKTETLQWLPGARSFYMRFVHFGIPISYLSACTFPKDPHFNTAVIQLLRQLFSVCNLFNKTV